MKRLVASLLLLTLLSGCTSDPLAEQFRSGDNKNYIAGDGTVTEFAIDERPSFSEWSGVADQGYYFKSSSLDGFVVVMNWWYAACAPCRAEAPELAALSKEFADQKVEFIGVNVRDTYATSLAFNRRFGIEYRTMMDQEGGGSVSLAFSGVVSPQAVPTTLVITRDGKVASRVLGRIDKSVLRELIETVIEE